MARVDCGPPEPTDINRCLEDALKEAWNELQYKCKVEREFGDLPMVQGHPGQLKQAFVHVLVNAAQAIPEKGIIRIRTSLEQDRVAIEIEDTGTGIAEADMPKLFTPFFTTRPVGQGTGLGLPISYGIIRRPSWRNGRADPIRPRNDLHHHPSGPGLDAFPGDSRWGGTPIFRNGPDPLPKPNPNPVKGETMPLPQPKPDRISILHLEDDLPGRGILRCDLAGRRPGMRHHPGAEQGGLSGRIDGPRYPIRPDLERQYPAGLQRRRGLVPGQGRAPGTAVHLPLRFHRRRSGHRIPENGSDGLRPQGSRHPVAARHHPRPQGNP